jgi:hypothetical protein
VKTIIYQSVTHLFITCIKLVLHVSTYLWVIIQGSCRKYKPRCSLKLLSQYGYVSMVLSLNILIESIHSFIHITALPLEHRAYVKLFFSLQFLNLQTVGMTPWMGDQPVARPLPAQDNTNTE